MLYIFKSIPVDKFASYDDDICSCCICLSRVWGCTIICLYRPPNASYTSFQNLLDFISDFLHINNSDNRYKTLIFEDFNFPGIEWGQRSETSCPPNSFYLLSSFMDTFFLTQNVTESTRMNNILDLFFTEDPHFVQTIRTQETPLSDHKILNIFTSFFNDTTFTKTPVSIEGDEHLNNTNFNMLNLRSLNVSEISKDLDRINWNSVVSGPVDSFPSKFTKVVYETIRKHTNLLKINKRSIINRTQHTANRKIRKYRNRILLSRNPVVIENLKRKITTLQESKKNAIFKESIRKENQAVLKIKKDPKFFYKYVKRFQKLPYSPNILLDPDGNIISNPKAIADTLQNQFCSVFSTPIQIQDIIIPFETLIPDFPLSDNLDLTKNDFITAINEMKSGSACPRNDIPSVIFKTFKNSLWKPLQLFWTKSFQTGQIPKQYKHQTTIAIHKKGPKILPENHRPIAITPNPIKIFERVLRKKLSNYLEINNFLSDSQHGFRKNRSTSTQLLSHTCNIYNNLINGNEVDCIYLDYSKAFDRVDHNIILQKLQKFSIGSNYITWIRNFLIGRTQVVVIGDELSYPTLVQSGVPQGSVLGPFFFSIYTNDLPSILDNCQILSFADDSKLISKINSVPDTIFLQDNLTTVMKWSKLNNMALNFTKLELIIFKPSQTNKSLNLLKFLPFFNQFFQYELPNNKLIVPSSHVRDLGVEIDDELDWSTHITNIVKKARRVSGWVLNTFHTRDAEIMLTLYKSLIRPILEYSSEIWNPFKKKHIIQIENIQRSFTSKISGLDKMNYWERISNLKINSLQRRREKNIIIAIWKIKNKINPNPIDLKFKDHNRTSAIKAILPPLPRTNAKLITKYEESFSVKGCKLWNCLPPRLTKITSLDMFKNALGGFLTGLPDKPPTPGYYTTNGNSVVDIV